MIIRKIKPADNISMAEIVKTVIVEMGAPKVGTAFEDVSLNDLHSTYDKKDAVYFVLESDEKIVGGAGIARLENEGDAYCELQKMYFLNEVRGKGYGMKMMQTCLNEAKEMGYKFCYIETMPYMEDAQKLYKKAGFEYLDAPMGNTGHYSCSVWMLKKL
ncbi:GNAT family N-acetyltransferase [Joostella sp. CR20]|uniref:GNAT family N-acetyltransferase n=1 Tax=Joostella sp. CR20 TaxID=2804312 RepID=UPI00313E9F1C